MSHYEQRLADDKAAIRARIVELGRRCTEAVKQAGTALLAGDHAASYRIILNDLPINRESRSIDKACHAFVARHLPSAAHLRFVSSVMRMNVELERVGDYAAAVSRHAVQLHRPPEGRIAEELAELFARGPEMMADALSAFETGDAELARETKSMAKALQHGFDVIFDQLTTNPDVDLRQGAHILSVLSKLERVTDQAKNICEDTVFSVTGEGKQPKIYRIAFLEDQDNFLGPMAVAIARKAFPQSARFTSAGPNPAPALDPEFVAWMEARGFNLQDLHPTPIDWPPEDWEQFHVVISLDGPVSRYLDPPPFNTAVLEWNIETGDSPDPNVRYEHAFQQLTTYVRDLMETMRGEEAV